MEKIFSLMMRLMNVKSRVGKMKDPMLIGILAGLLGTIAMDIVNLILFATRRSENTLAHMGAAMLVSKRRTKHRKNTFLGQIWHMMTGMSLALLMTATFKKTGITNHRVKGAFMGALSWGFLYNLGTRLRLYSLKPSLTKTHYSYLLTALIYGVVTAEAIKTLADPILFQNSDRQSTLSKSESQEASLSGNPFENECESNQMDHQDERTIEDWRLAAK